MQSSNTLLQRPLAHKQVNKKRHLEATTKRGWGGCGFSMSALNKGVENDKYGSDIESGFGEPAAPHF